MHEVEVDDIVIELNNGVKRDVYGLIISISFPPSPSLINKYEEWVNDIRETLKEVCYFYPSR